jgi:hypothetical protein
MEQAVREQNRQRDGKKPPPPPEEQVNAQRLLAERAERDRALAAERNAQARAKELQAQIRQIVEAHRVKREGEIPYRYTDGDKIKTLYVNEALRKQLAKGALVIVRLEADYELVPRVAADMIYERGGAIVLDHGRSAAPPATGSDDEYYQRFAVPDDLIW